MKEFFRILDRQGGPQRRAKERKYCSVRADAEGEGEDGGRRKAGGFAQHAEAVTQILHHILNPVDAAGVAAFFLGLLETAEVEAGAAMRIFLCQPLREIFLGFSLEVVAQLVVQFLVGLRAAKQRPQPQGNREQPMLRSHTPHLRFAPIYLLARAHASFSLITREMALESLPQLSASFSRWRRPSF